MQLRHTGFIPNEMQRICRVHGECLLQADRICFPRNGSRYFSLFLLARMIDNIHGNGKIGEAGIGQGKVGAHIEVVEFNVVRGIQVNILRNSHITVADRRLPVPSQDIPFRIILADHPVRHIGPRI